jgi:selenium metabolism protein YedF
MSELIQVDARGEACPIPVIKTKQAIQTLQGEGTVETLVDNEIAVQNLTKMAEQKGYGVSSTQEGDNSFRVRMTIGEDDCNAAPEKVVCQPMPVERNIVVTIGADHMGEGDDQLGRTLLKGFIFALTMQEEQPSAILFFNGGAHLTCEGSDSLEDLKTMAARGVEILTCGTCLDFYQLKDKLAVGGVTNMYDIVERQMKASLVLKP